LTTLALGLPNRVAEQFAAQAFAVRNYARPRGEAATQIWQMQEGLRLRIHWREAWLEHLTALN
jgi:hypothetical protein